MKQFLFIVLAICSLHSSAQLEFSYNATSSETPEWAKKMYASDADPGMVKSAYEAYYLTKPVLKNQHTQYYKRWMRNISRMVYGQSEGIAQSSNSSANWQCIGPFDFDQDAASRSYACGSAHVYTAEQAISNPNTLYAGTATAGLFKSTNKGESWQCLTESMGIGTVYALEIDHSNENTVYFVANGNLYKSSNGGVSFTIMGDAVFQDVSLNTKDIVCHPSSANTLFLADENGLYKTTNAGSNWTQLMSGSFLEIEFHPSNTDIIYIVEAVDNKTVFHKSIDGGNNFSSINNGWPNPTGDEEQKRTEIAVSTDMPNRVVALATGSANGGSGLYGIYVSDDMGENWSFRCCGPQPAGVPDTTNINLMGWSDEGTDDGGQYYYDLALNIDPNNGDKIHVGGVNHWISTDGGFTFTCPAKWSHPDKDEYVHADIHDIKFYGDDLWISCDGGLFYSNDGGAHIDKKMYGISGTDFWGFGAGFADGEVMLGGTYHNGTLLKDKDTYLNGWLSTDGGDNIRGFVNFGNPRMAYSDYGGKILSGDRDVAIDGFSFNLLPNASYTAGESSQIEFHPACYNILYAGVENELKVSYNNGASSTTLYDFGEKVTSVEVAWSNPDVIYVATWTDWWGDKHLWKSTDGGNSFTDITPSGIEQTWIPFDITISSNDENTLWIARCSMYGGVQDAQGEEVFTSTDGGTNWVNLSSSTLDNTNATNIEHQRGSDGGVYLGTRTGVYYRDNSMNDWEPFQNGLPTNSYSTQLVPYYKGSKLRNGTNRSAWEADFYNQSAPSAQIAAEKLSVNCFENSVQFVDHSAVSNQGTNWEWSFPGGTPNSSNIENPIVTYDTPGSYDVTLTVSDNFGTSTQTISNLIEFTNELLLLDVTEDFESGEMPPANWRMPPASFSWENIEIENGVDCTPTQSAYVNHYYIDQTANEATLQGPQLDLGNAEEPFLSFDYAYAQYNANNVDGLRIEVSIDCGLSWTSIFEAVGDSLATVDPQGDWWEPACGEWVNKQLDLEAFKGEVVSIRFISINDYGNSFYMDNIQMIDNNPANILNNQWQRTLVYPNPNTGDFFVKTDLAGVNLSVLDLNGKLLYQQKLLTGNNMIHLPPLASGIYIASLEKQGNSSYQKLSIH